MPQPSLGYRQKKDITYGNSTFCSSTPMFKNTQDRIQRVTFLKGNSYSLRRSNKTHTTQRPAVRSTWRCSNFFFFLFTFDVEETALTLYFYSQPPLQRACFFLIVINLPGSLSSCNKLRVSKLNRRFSLLKGKLLTPYFLLVDIMSGRSRTWYNIHTAWRECRKY